MTQQTERPNADEQAPAAQGREGPRLQDVSAAVRVLAPQEQHTAMVKETGPVTLPTNFFAKVKIGSWQECWEWQGGRAKSGHGRFWFDASMKPSHRLMYRHCWGEIPEGWFICHHCDNPPCVNPLHIYAGTPADNTNDMHRRKRVSRTGSLNGNSKLNEAAVRNIRDLNDKGTGLRQLARQFEVSQSTIHYIIARKTWNHV